MPTGRRMATFEQGDVVKVPFPYTDRAARAYRPALVVSAPAIEERHGLLWLVMITSAANRGWTGDVRVRDLRRARLPVASIVRTAKVATIDAKDAVRLGRLGAANLTLVLTQIRTALGL